MLKVGDRVKNKIFGEGVIKHIKGESLRYAVEFDKINILLHNCCGHCKSGHGYWCDTNTLLEKEKIELIKEEDNKKVVKSNLDDLERYIIKEDACIVFWKDGSKTVVKKMDDVEHNKELAFLTAYFQKHSGLTKSKANKFLANLVETEQAKKEKKIIKNETKLTMEEIVEEDNDFKIGDKVKVVNKNGGVVHCFEIGDVLEVIGIDVENKKYIDCKRENLRQTILASNIEKIN